MTGARRLGHPSTLKAQKTVRFNKVMPKPRWGVRFSADPNRDKNFVQALYTDDNANVKRGELFLNEPRAELYYVGGDGIAKRVGEDDVVPFDQIDFTGIQEFADDSAAAGGSIPVGGLYHSAGVLKVRIA